MAPAVVRRTRGVKDAGEWEARFLMDAWPWGLEHEKVVQVDGESWGIVRFRQLVESIEEV